MVSVLYYSLFVEENIETPYDIKINHNYESICCIVNEILSSSNHTLDY